MVAARQMAMAHQGDLTYSPYLVYVLMPRLYQVYRS